MTDDSTPVLRLQNALDKRDWSQVRAVGEELLDTFQHDTPPALRAKIHYLIADAIINMNAVTRADLESAHRHLANAVDDLSPESARAFAYISLARVVVKIRPAGPVALREALDALDRALELLSKDMSDLHYAEARFSKGRAYEMLGDGDSVTLRRAIAEYEAAYQAFGLTRSVLNRGTAAYHVGRLLSQLPSPDNDVKGKAARYLEEAWRTYQAAGLKSKAQDAAQLLASVRETSTPGDGIPETETSQDEEVSDAVPPEIRAEAIAGIRSSETRRVYLKHWIDGHVSSQSERTAFWRDFLYVPMLSDAVATGEEAERQNDPALRELAELLVQDAKMFFEYMLKRDAERDTHQQALEILRRHLDGLAGFVLLLRNFDIDITKGRWTKRLERALFGGRSQFVNWLMGTTDAEEERFARLIAG